MEIIRKVMGIIALALNGAHQMYSIYSTPLIMSSKPHRD